MKTQNKTKTLVSYGIKMKNPRVKRISFEKVVNDIKNGKYKIIIDEIRNESDKRLRNLDKLNNLAYFTFAVFKDNYKKNSNFLKTNYIIIDVDSISRNKIELVRDYYRKSKRAFCCFVSPSGNGLKIIYKLSRYVKNEKEYKIIYNYIVSLLLNNLKIKVDYTPDVSRPSYISFDPDIVYCPECKTINVDEKLSEANTTNEIINEDIDLSLLPDIINFLIGKLNYIEWIKCGFALASLGEKGRKYFTQLTIEDERFKDNEKFSNEKYDELLSKYDESKTHIKRIFHLADKKGFEFKKYKIRNFWNVEDGKCKVLYTKYIDFLTERGFYKIDSQGKYIFVHKVNNIINKIKAGKIRDAINDFLDNSKNTDVKEILTRNNRSYFDDKLFEGLKTLDNPILKDTKEKSFIFFKNCYVEVTKDSIIKKEYKDLGKYVIWEKYIKNRNFERNVKRSDFSKFISNVCRNKKRNIKALKSCIGYLLHTYKNPSLTKAIIFCDENISENANGGSGKSLVGDAIAEIRNLVEEGGRRLNLNDKFAFQKIDLDTQIIEFDDAKKDFPFDVLFHDITGGMVVEKKFKDSFVIPFESSPKILITTNFTIKGEDVSTKRRKYEFEFSNFYNDKHIPIDDFKKEFFKEEWSEEDWNTFYTFMINCVRLYLKEGLISCRNKSLKYKKLIDHTDPDFAKYIKTIDKTIEYSLRVLYKDFLKKCKGSDNSIFQNKFTKWLNYYGELFNYDIVKRYSNSRTFIKFNKK